MVDGRSGDTPCRDALPDRGTGRSGPGQVLAGAGVHLDLLAGIDEERDLEDQAGLDGGRLAGAGHPVPLEPRFGVGDGELDGGRQVDPDDLRPVELQDGVVAFLQVVGRVAQEVRRHLELLVRRRVHEHVVGAVPVQELHLALVDDGLLELLVGPVGPLDDGPGALVLQFGAHEGAALARLDVLELDHGEQALGQVERHAIAEIIGGDSHQTATSFGNRVSGRLPFAVTTRVSSMLTPPVPGRYTPGSTVTTVPAARIAVDPGPTDGPSWMSSPTPWPVPCSNRSAQPDAAITSRHTWSTEPAVAPGTTAATPARCEAATTSNTVASSPDGAPPTQNVLVMSDR